jgi:prolyl 4-hydroxylase
MIKIKWILLFLLLVGLIILLYLLFSKEKLSLPKHLTAVPLKRKHTEKILAKHASQIVGTKETPIYIIENFMSPEECDGIIKSSQGKLVPSPLTRQDPNDSAFRTSETCYFDGSGNQGDIERKIIEKINLHQCNTEESQIQHYRVGNEFKAHWDYFDPKEDGEFLKNGQRTWTFMVYLNDVEKGGETEFVNLKQNVYPKKGTAAVWCNIKEDGTPDEMTMHQGSPVLEGEKWIITKWFLQDNPYGKK